MMNVESSKTSYDRMNEKRKNVSIIVFVFKTSSFKFKMNTSVYKSFINFIVSIFIFERLTETEAEQLTKDERCFYCKRRNT